MKTKNRWWKIQRFSQKAQMGFPRRHEGRKENYNHSGHKGHGGFGSHRPVCHASGR